MKRKFDIHNIKALREYLREPKKPKPTIIPKLKRADVQLCYDALGFWSSDYNDAPHDEIQKLREKLIKLGAKS